MKLDNYTATETCGCGASITVQAWTALDLSRRLTEWREQHRHEEGIRALVVADVGGCTCTMTRDPETNECKFSLVGCKYHEAAAAQPWNHRIPWNCPTYWDGCNCNDPDYWPERQEKS